MSWVITGSEKNPVDLYRSNVSLLLHGDGTNGSTTIIDSSPSPKEMTAIGNAQVSTAQSKPGFGGSSLLFDGNGDAFKTPRSAAFDFGTGDFTVECWCYIAAARTNALLFSTAGNNGSGDWRGFLLEYSISRGLFAAWRSSSGTTSCQYSTTPPTETWQHVAFARSSGTSRLFIDGQVVQTAANTGTIADASPSLDTAVGAGANGTDSFNGYIDEFRVTKGVARYTANFTLPTAPFPDI